MFIIFIYTLKTNILMKVNLTSALIWNTFFLYCKTVKQAETMLAIKYHKITKNLSNGKYMYLIHSFSDNLQYAQKNKSNDYKGCNFSRILLENK